MDEIEIEFWLDSGANAFSCREDRISLKSLGLTEKEWDALTEKEQEELMRPIVFDQSEWGFRKVKKEG